MEEIVSGLIQLYSISKEPIVGVNKGIVVFMNPAAIHKTGGDSTGKPASALLPQHILNTQAGSFVSSAIIDGKRAAVSATTVNGLRVYLLSFEMEEDYLDLEPPISTTSRVLLSSIKLAADRLAFYSEEYGDERIAKCTSAIQHNYHKLYRLLMNVTLASAISRGNMPCYSAATDMKELCRNLTEATAYLAKKRGISVVFECAEKSCDAVVDKELIEQMLLNILSNSLIHLNEGGHVRVTLMRTGNRIVISIDDNGSGIPAEILSTVFSRWRENRSLTETANGAGLGLSVARGIAERHGGALIVESKEQEGTSVRVMLPTNNEPTVVFRSSETPYEMDAQQPVMIHLSTWLNSSEYLKGLNF